MNTRSSINHRKIKYLLNRSAMRIEAPVLQRLHLARTQALMRYDSRRSSPVWAWAGNFTWSSNVSPQKIHFWTATVLIVIFLLGASTYLSQAAGSDTSDVDIAILTDDLPMHVYID